MKVEVDYEDLRKNFDSKVVRKLSDMKEKYKDPSNVKDKVIYEVYIKDFGTFEAALTILNQGTVNGEFFMTKGHRHKKPRGEIDILTKRKGKLLIQETGKNGKAKSIEMKKSKMYFIPPRAGHRAVNTGNKEMEFMSFYAKDAGHDYKFKFGKRFFRR